MALLQHTWRRMRGSMRVIELAAAGLTTLLLAAGAVVIMIPLAFMISTSLKDPAQIRSDANALLPRTLVMQAYNGDTYPVYTVTTPAGTKTMLMLKKAPGGNAIFVDPQQPDIQLTLPLATQQAQYALDIHWSNYPDAVQAMPFVQYLVNTLLVTFVGMAGMLFSSALVAYGFSRFRARWLDILFLVLLSTIMLPSQVRLIPIYVFFQQLGWINTLLPLIVPQFFANAYDVFLLRQFIMTIPLELDDAARIDGANPLEILLYIILPQARPALVSVAIFHFLYAWNDFYEPLIFLHTKDQWTLAVGLQTFDSLYTINTHLIMAVSVLMIVPPIVLFFLAQRIFTQGVVFSGVKG